MVRLNAGSRVEGSTTGNAAPKIEALPSRRKAPRARKARPSAPLRAKFQASDGRDDGGHDGGHGPGLAAEQLQAHGPAGHRQQQHRQQPDEPAPCPVADVAVGLQRQEGQPVQEGEADDGEAAEHGVAAEPGERAAHPVAVGVQRQARGGQRQRGADAEGGDEGAGRDGPVPAGAPRGVSTLPRYSKATARKISATSTSSSGR